MTPLALDIAVASVIILSTLVAYFRGIVTEFFMLAGFGLAIFLSYSGGHLLVPDVGKLVGVLPNPADEKATVFGILKPTMAANVGAYGGVFLFVFLLMVAIRVMISHWVNASGLGLADRLFGALFGFARGFMLVFLLYIVFLLLSPAQGDREKLPEWVKNSNSASFFDKTIVWANTHIDLDKMIDGLAKQLDKIDHGKFGKKMDAAAADLKEEVKKEEAAIQKAPEKAPETPPAAVPTTPVTAEPVSAPAPAAQPPAPGAPPAVAPPPAAAPGAPPPPAAPGTPPAQ